MTKLRGLLAECCGSDCRATQTGGGGHRGRGQGATAMVRRVHVRGTAANLLVAAAIIDTASAALKGACTGTDGSWTTATGVAIDCLNISHAAEEACAAVIHIAGMFLRTLHPATGNSRARGN